MSTGWYYSSRQRPCPLCHNTHGCRIFEPDKVWCLRTFDGLTAGPGWRFIGLLDGGMGGSFIRENASAIRQFSPSSDEIPTARKKRNPLPESARDAGLRKLHRALGLSESDRHYLLERGVTEAEIKSKLYFSLNPRQDLPFGITENFPGRWRGRHTFTNHVGGIACIAFNEHNQAIGIQVRTRNMDTDERYRWLSNKINCAHLPNGELPLTFLKPSRIRCPYIGLVEGIGLKPQIASQRLGQLIIGASGGQFLASTKLLRRYIDAARNEEFNPRVIQIYPDAGDVINRHVIRRLAHLVDFLKSSGYRVQIAWWNQLAKHNSPDIDELPNLSSIEYIDAEKFTLLRNWRRAYGNYPIEQES